MRLIIGSILLNVLGLTGCAAHMKLDWPTPYGVHTLNNSPLESSGSDFPCKLRAGVYEVAEMNYWTAGETRSVRFLGSAVHGGGSCQFSITTDAEPTKTSRWKVIDSRVGGCPANAAGNLEGGSTAHVADSFDVMLPAGVQNGRYTFAWTWFNRMGNREMYMNCAPIVVRDGGDNSTFLDTLPDMFVANLPDSDCATVANFDLAFPEPGDYVVTAKEAQVALTVNGVGCASMTRLGAGAGIKDPFTRVAETLDGQGNRGLKSEATNVVTEHLVEPSHTKSLGVPTTSLVVQIKPVDLVPLAQLEQSQTVSVVPLVGVGGKAATAASPELCVACKVPGSVICIDDRGFGLCDGTCALRQTLAPGTLCSGGLIFKRSVH